LNLVPTIPRQLISRRVSYAADVTLHIELNCERVANQKNTNSILMQWCCWYKRHKTQRSRARPGSNSDNFTLHYTSQRQQHIEY